VNLSTGHERSTAIDTWTVQTLHSKAVQQCSTTSVTWLYDNDQLSLSLAHTSPSPYHAIPALSLHKPEHQLMPDKLHHSYHLVIKIDFNLDRTKFKHRRSMCLFTAYTFLTIDVSLNPTKYSYSQWTGAFRLSSVPSIRSCLINNIIRHPDEDKKSRSHLNVFCVRFLCVPLCIALCDLFLH